MTRLHRSNFTTKILFICVIVIIAYVVFVIGLGLVAQQPVSMHTMPHMMNPGQNTYAVLALPLALLVGVVTAFLIQLDGTSHSPPLVDEFAILKKALSDDEQAVLQEVQRAGEITQDSLRFRLDWSKAKLSRILTRLDNMNLIQRERVGRTYNVFIPKHRK